MAEPSEADLAAASVSKSKVDNRSNHKIRQDEVRRVSPAYVVKGAIQMGLQRGYVLHKVMGVPVPAEMRRQSEWVWPGLTMDFLRHASRGLEASKGGEGARMIVDAVARQPVQEWPLWESELLPWVDKLLTENPKLTRELLHSASLARVPLLEFVVGEGEFDSGGNRFPCTLDATLPPGTPVLVFLNQKLVQKVFVDMIITIMDTAGIDFAHPGGVVHPLLHAWMHTLPKKMEMELKERDPARRKRKTARGPRRKGAKKTPAQIKYEANLKMLRDPWQKVPAASLDHGLHGPHGRRVNGEGNICEDDDGDLIPWEDLDDAGLDEDGEAYIVMGNADGEWYETWTTQEEVLRGEERKAEIDKRVAACTEQSPDQWKEVMERWDALRHTGAGASETTGHSRVRAEPPEDLKGCMRNGVVLLSKEELQARRIAQASRMLDSSLYRGMVREGSMEAEWLEKKRQFPMAHIIMITREKNPMYTQHLYHLPFMSHEHVEAGLCVANWTRHFLNVQHQVLDWEKDAEPLLRLRSRQRQPLTYLDQALWKWGKGGLGEPMVTHIPRALPWECPVVAWFHLNRGDLMWTLSPMHVAELCHVTRQEDPKRLFRVQYNPEAWM